MNMHRLRLFRLRCVLRPHPDPLTRIHAERAGTGAAGFLLKDTEPEQVAQAVRTLARAGLSFRLPDVVA